MNGNDGEVTTTTSSRQPVVLRVYDEKDGIPIPINGEMYVLITPMESPDYQYNYIVKPGKFL